jgi:hypothetical protein
MLILKELILILDKQERNRRKNLSKVFIFFCYQFKLLIFSINNYIENVEKEKSMQNIK